MALNLPEELPSSGAVKAQLLDGVLERGIEKLLAEVKNKNYIVAPHGRKPEPTPLISEEDFLLEGCLQDPPEADEPQFNFEYGFNPLKFLADHLRWSHPDSVKERRLERIRCVERLQFLAEHAKEQLATSSALRALALRQGSGIMWGPVCAVESPTSLTCVIQPNALGTLTLEVATNAAFTDVVKTVTETVCEPTNETTPLKVLVEGLKPLTKYHLRCYVAGANGSAAAAIPAGDCSVGSVTKSLLTVEAADEAKGGDSTEAAAALVEEAAVVEGEQLAAPAADVPIELFYAQCTTTWTPPLTGDEEEEPPVQVDPDVESEDEKAQPAVEEVPNTVTLACIPADFSRKSALPTAAVTTGKEFVATCLVGDPFNNHAASESQEETYSVDLWGVYCGSAMLSSADGVARNGGLFLGWNDTRLGSDVDVRAEEVKHKQYLHDLKRHTKKYEKSKKSSSKKDPHPAPTHNRPKLSLSLERLVQAFPVTYVEEGACRSLHKSTKVGPFLEVFQLDVRGGYVPKAQIKWLRDALSHSSASWKIVLTGAPVGIMADAASHGSHAEKEDVKEKKEKEGDEEVAAGEAASASVEGEKKVQVLPPESHKEKDKEDVDEQGRPKNSLRYVIASLQRSHARHAHDHDEEEGDAADADVDDTGMPESAAEAEEADAIIITSGIVFVSSTSFGQGLPQSAPYIVTFDPSESGDAYCAEVNVGGGASSAPPAGTKVSHCVTDKNGTQFLYGEEAVRAGDDAVDPILAVDHSAVLRLEESGTLVVELVRLGRVDTENDAPSMVTVKRFRLPN